LVLSTLEIFLFSDWSLIRGKFAKVWQKCGFAPFDFPPCSKTTHCVYNKETSHGIRIKKR